MNKTAPLPDESVMSLELVLTVGLPFLSIAVGSILAFVAYASGFTEIVPKPAAIVVQH